MAQVANVTTTATVFRHQLAGGLLRHETCRYDDANVDEVEAQSRQTPPVVSPARNVPLYIPERRKTQESDVYFIDLQMGRDRLQ